MANNFNHKKTDLSRFDLDQLGIIGVSPQIKIAINQLIEVAPTDLSVLITGETGTGKEVFASALHRLSLRWKEPFVSVNCAAIPENLLESELFGYEKGAFTGAVDRRIGFFESANKGTIFLDEIGEMPISLQVKLLRILESGQYSRLGSSEIRKVDVRVITATNRILENEVVRGNFRQDLFYRLNSYKIHLPALRDRTEDIPILFEFFARQTAQLYKFEFQGISQQAIEILKKLQWSGNVRELKHFTEKIVTLERGEYITPSIIHKYLPPALPESSMLFDNSNTQLVTIPKKDEFQELSSTLILKALLQIDSKIEFLNSQQERMLEQIKSLNERISSLQESNYYSVEEESDTLSLVKDEIPKIDQMEKTMIIKAIKQCNGNKTRAAKLLGVSLRTLYRKINRYNLDV